MNRIARLAFVAALISFIAFHFVEFWHFTEPDLDADTTGWRIWTEIPTTMGSPSHLDGVQMIFWSCFLTSSLLVASSPFLVGVVRVSRLAWWIGALTSGVATIALGGFLISLVSDHAEISPGLGFTLLLAAMLLNFLGFFFIRREIPPNPVTDPA
jgi:hypothetical protein